MLHVLQYPVVRAWSLQYVCVWSSVGVVCVAVYCDSGKEQVPGSETCQLCQKDFIKPAAGSGRCNQCTGNYTSDASRTVCNVCMLPAAFLYSFHVLCHQYIVGCIVSGSYLRHGVLVSKFTEKNSISTWLNLSLHGNCLRCIYTVILYRWCKCFASLMSICVIHSFRQVFFSLINVNVIYHAYFQSFYFLFFYCCCC